MTLLSTKYLSKINSIGCNKIISSNFSNVFLFIIYPTITTLYSQYPLQAAECIGTHPGILFWIYCPVNSYCIVLFVSGAIT